MRSVFHGASPGPSTRASSVESGERALERGNRRLLQPQPSGFGAQAHGGGSDPESGGDALLREALPEQIGDLPALGGIAGRAGRRGGGGRPPRRRRRRRRGPRPRPCRQRTWPARPPRARERTRSPRAARISAGRGGLDRTGADPDAPPAVAQQRQADRKSGRGARRSAPAARRRRFAAPEGEPFHADPLDERDAFRHEISAGPAVTLVRGDDEHLSSGGGKPGKHHSFILLQSCHETSLSAQRATYAPHTQSRADEASGLHRLDSSAVVCQRGAMAKVEHFEIPVDDIARAQAFYTAGPRLSPTSRGATRWAC